MAAAGCKRQFAMKRRQRDNIMYDNAPSADAGKRGKLGTGDIDQGVSFLPQQDACDGGRGHFYQLVQPCAAPL